MIQHTHQERQDIKIEPVGYTPNYEDRKTANSTCYSTEAPHRAAPLGGGQGEEPAETQDARDGRGMRRLNTGGGGRTKGFVRKGGRCAAR